MICNSSLGLRFEGPTSGGPVSLQASRSAAQADDPDRRNPYQQYQQQHGIRGKLGGGAQREGPAGNDEQGSQDGADPAQPARQGAVAQREERGSADEYAQRQ